MSKVVKVLQTFQGVFVETDDGQTYDFDKVPPQDTPASFAANLSVMLSGPEGAAFTPKDLPEGDHKVLWESGVDADVEPVYRSNPLSQLVGSLIAERRMEKSEVDDVEANIIAVFTDFMGDPCCLWDDPKGSLSLHFRPRDLTGRDVADDVLKFTTNPYRLGFYPGDQVAARMNGPLANEFLVDVEWVAEGAVLPEWASKVTANRTLN